MTGLRLFFLYYYGLILAVFEIRGEHAASISVSETDLPGTLLLNETSECSVTSLDPEQRENYVIFVDQKFLEIKKPLDLEVLNLKENSAILTVNYDCGNDAKSVDINITPVNEFSPVFIGAPFHSRIKEGSAIGTQVLFLGDKWSDDDKIKYGNNVTFGVHLFGITAFDGRQYFKMDQETGNITTSKELDYESLQWRHYFILNISVADDGGRISFSTVNITILDIDDNPPVFTSPQYTAIIDRYFQGSLSEPSLKISPQRIFAQDRDTGIDAKIVYSIESDDEMVSNIQINNVTGEVEIVLPYNNVTSWTENDVLKNVSLNVTATEESTNRYHTDVSLTVLVYRDFPTTTISPPTSESTSSSSATTSGNGEPESQIDPILLVEIIVPIVVVVIILIIVVCLIRGRERKHRDTTYKLSERQKVEKNRKSENFENENIDVISSTLVRNSYELINMYARMDPKRSSKGGSSKSSIKTEDDASSGKNGEQYEVKTDLEGGKYGENEMIADAQRETTGQGGNLYTKVRKPRKRQTHGMAFLNDAFDNVAHVDNEGDVTVSEPDSGDDIYENVEECNSETQSEQLGEMDDLSREGFETAVEPSEVKSGDFSRFSAVDNF